MAENDATTLARDAGSCLAIDIAGVRLLTEPWLGIAKLQVLAQDPDAWFAQALGIDPPPPLTEIERNGLAVAWLAPGELLVTGAESQVEQIRRHCDDAAGVLGLMTDLTHARAAFALSGAMARTALSAHCPLDLADAAMPVGAALRSMFGDAGVFISRRADRDGQPCFRLIFDQTMSGYAERMLGTTIAEECS